MCYAGNCNPLCGKCQPKRIVEISCPQCGSSVNISRDVYLNLFGLPHKKSIPEKKMLERGPLSDPICTYCDAPLRDAFDGAVKPEACMRMNIVCGFPCGRAGEQPQEGARPCPYMVPLKKLS